jgi:NAD(P)-dependent dehydrogenase (short-subunit alcohol dehydrogenase family)
MSQMEPRTLSGRVAVVTGGSRGLGKAISMSLGSAGASLALVGRDETALRAAAEEVRESGTEVATFQTDITEEQQVDRLKGEILSRFSRVDILVNNAGVNVRKPISEFPLEEWNRVLATNLTGPFLMCRAFVPQMRGRGYGRIINLTSIMSHVSIPGRTAYSASKAGLLGFTKALALELAAEGITVVAISPGPFGTEMNTALIQDPNTNREFVTRIPVGRWGNAEEVGQLARYLCSPEAGFVTGTDILIDGGWTAQ